MSCISLSFSLDSYSIIYSIHSWEVRLHAHACKSTLRESYLNRRNPSEGTWWPVIIEFKLLVCSHLLWWRRRSFFPPAWRRTEWWVSAVCEARSTPPVTSDLSPVSGPVDRPSPGSPRSGARPRPSSWTGPVLLHRCCSRAAGTYRCRCPGCTWKHQNLQRTERRGRFSDGGDYSSSIVHLKLKLNKPTEKKLWSYIRLCKKYHSIQYLSIWSNLLTQQCLTVAFVLCLFCKNLC